MLELSLAQDKIYDVVIVGGGPVGMGLAIELGQRGISVAVVERYAAPQSIPKGQNLTQRTMEHFHFWGAESELRAARTVPTEYGIGGITCYGTLLGEYHYDWLQRELVRPFYYTDHERLPQYATEAVLRARVGELASVDTFYGFDGGAVSQDDGGASVVVKERHGPMSATLCGRYLVGCDGSGSAIRDGAGITQTRRDHDKLMVLIVFRSTELHELVRRYPGKSFYNVLHPALEGYWQFFGRVDLGNTWFFHAPVPMGTTKDNFDFAKYLHGAVGRKFAVEFEHIGFWELRIAIADAYQKGRIFIAGDAAHSHPPYGGYGINTGFEDARNLGWKLAAVLKGWAGPKLLETYDEERRPVFVSTAGDFIETSISSDRRFMAEFSPEKDPKMFKAEWEARGTGAKAEVNSFEPNYEGSSILSGPETGARPSAVGKHSHRARAGHHLSPKMLSSGQNVFEALGRDFTLLAFGADQDEIAAFEYAAKTLRMPLTVISDSAAGGREEYGARMVLVRPDQFVAWVADGPCADAGEILAQLAGAEHTVSTAGLSALAAFNQLCRSGRL